MPAILLYLVKLSCSLGVLWLFYRLVLHNLTFYTLNRWYLLGYTLLSFLIPLVNIGPIRGEDPTLQPVILQYIPVIDKPLAYAAPSVASDHATHWDTWNILLLVLAIGSCFLLARFLIRCYSLRNLRRRAVLLLKGPVSIYRIAEAVSPFSFGNAIYVNTDQHGEKEWEEIILHEYVHIRQRHTLDILFGELLIILNWYNPFAWLIRFAIRQNLEFIADQAVIDNGFDKKGYQYHLLKVVGQTRYKLANNFNFSSLKKRIIMMNKMKSARIHLLRFLFILPLLTVLLVAFRKTAMPSLEASSHDIFVIAPDLTRSASADPDYTDAFHALQQVLRENNQMNNYKAIEKAHPKPADTVPRKPGTSPRAATHNRTFRQDTSTMPSGPTVYIVDGNVVDSNALASLAANDIWMVTIPKPGVVVVQTKSTTWPHVVLETKDSEGKPMKVIADSLHTPEGDIHAENNVPETPHTQPGRSTDAIRIRPSQSSAGVSILAQMLSNDPATQRPLYILNGIVVDQSTLIRLNPDDITSINVINPKAAKANYGDRAINGAILISAKDPGKTTPPPPQN